MKIPEDWEIIILKRRRDEKEIPFPFPVPSPLSPRNVFWFVTFIVGGLAWGLHLTGLTDEMWHVLFWLRWIPTGIIGIGVGVSLAPKVIRLVKKLREYTEIKQ